MAQDELDVLQRYLARVEDASDGSAQIVGTEIVESDLVTAGVDDASDELSRQWRDRLTQRDVYASPLGAATPVGRASRG